MSTLVMLDGRLCAPGDATVSVFDRGFLYGDSVFETLRTYGGVPFELDAHLQRLERSAGLVHIPLPLGRAELAAEISEAVAAAANAESYVRVMITRGQGPMGLDPALAGRPLRVIMVQPLQPPPAEQYTQGIGAISYATRRVLDASGVQGAKLGNYLTSVLAMREARLHGALEALILDAGGRVLEGASSNVFAVQGERLVTPPVEAGILPGITRGCLLELARQLGLAVELRLIPLEEAYAANELFITSSIRELLPVVRLDGRVLGTGAVGPVFRRLLAAFRAHVRRPP
jgi:branched-chain amino acid aminotransferase